jgi:hypothetical protein
VFGLASILLRLVTHLVSEKETRVKEGPCVRLSASISSAQIRRPHARTLEYTHARAQA